MMVRPFLATVLCALTLAACSATDAAEPAGATCDQFAASPTIEQARTIEAGADLLVVLCSNPTTGFSWGDPQVLDTSVIQVAGRTYQAPGATSSPIVGTAGAEVISIHGVASGTTTLSISYGQPWVGGIQDDWVYKLTVTVG